MDKSLYYFLKNIQYCSRKEVIMLCLAPYLDFDNDSE